MVGEFMGILFECGDQTIWSPSREVALYFLAQVRHLETRMGASCGLSEVVSDTVEIDHERLRSFIESVATWTNVNNLSMGQLLRPAMVHLLAILGSCSAVAETLLVPFPREWVEEAGSLGRRAMTSIVPPSISS